MKVSDDFYLRDCFITVDELNELTEDELFDLFNTEYFPYITFTTIEKCSKFVRKTFMRYNLIKKRGSKE